MESKLLCLFLSSIVGIVFGTPFILVGLFKLSYINKIKKNCAFTDGEVVRFFYAGTEAYPVVQYNIDGALYTLQYKGHKFHTRVKLKIGQQVTVQYSLKDEEHFLIADDKSIYYNAIGWLILGLSFIISGTVYNLPIILNS